MPSITQIVEQLKKFDDHYYNGQALASDETYDKLRDHLKQIDPNNSYFKTVGAVVSHRDEVELMMHMGSQNKAKNQKEMEKWFTKYDKPEVIVSDKLDGSSIEVVYLNGRLWRVATRGSGTHGLEVTRNARLWKGLPHSVEVEDKLIIRGEAQLSVSDWKNNFSETANPRNAGNGIVVCDTNYERNKYIAFHAFDIVHPHINFVDHAQKFKELSNLGFNTVRNYHCKCWEELLKCRSHYDNDRMSLEFEIDGMVVTINDIEKYDSLGYSDGGTRPRGSIAWKFESEKGITRVSDIELTVGSSGKIIPTAVLDPIKLAGTTVTHCLLNNFDYIERMGVNVGDQVVIQKAGDIIPNMVAVVGVEYECLGCGYIGDHKKQKIHDCSNKSSLVAINKDFYREPKFWRSSDGTEYPVTKVGSDCWIYDENCAEFSFARIKQWISKTGIKYLGDSVLMAMIKNGLVNDIDNLYKIDESSICQLQIGNGKLGSNGKKILSEIDQTREMTIDLFIGSLSIKHLGRSRAALLIDHGFDNIDKYLNANQSDFVGLPCSDTGTYGQDTANEMYESLRKRYDLITNLRKHISISSANDEISSGKLSGETYCLSGVRMTPDEKEKFKELGGEEKSNVSKGLTCLVLKDVSSSSSNKAEKARKLGIKIIDVDQFRNLLYN